MQQLAEDTVPRFTFLTRKGQGLFAPFDDGEVFGEVGRQFSLVDQLKMVLFVTFPDLTYRTL